MTPRAAARRVEEVTREQDSARRLAGVGFACIGILGLEIAFLVGTWRFVVVPHVWAHVWPIFVVVSYFGFCMAAVSTFVTAVVSFLFARESARKVAEMIREANHEREAPA